MIGFEQEPNRVVNVGTVSKQLRIILVELAIDLVDVAITNTPRLLSLSHKTCIVATMLMVASLMMILHTPRH